MRSRFFFGLSAGLVAAASTVAACGGDDNNGAGGAGGGGDGGGTPTTTTTQSGSPTTSTTATTSGSPTTSTQSGEPTATTGTSTSSGTGTGDGNDTFETAEPVTVPTAENGVQGTLEPVADDVDYYKFEGEAGQPLYVFTDAKPDEDPFGPTYPDLVVTLYDASKNQIARNDDPTPRTSNDPQLLTRLPTAGTYYLEVAECNKVFGSESCSPAAEIGEPAGYAFAIVPIDPEVDGFAQEKAEPNDDAAAASSFAFPKNPQVSTGYSASLLFGTFASQTDIDAYEFTVPADVTLDANERSVAYFSFYETGAEGNGSTTSIGQAYIASASAPTVKLASANVATGGELAVPLPAGDYVVFFPHPGGAKGANDFYFVDAFPAGSNPLEKAEAANDDLATAEVIGLVPNGENQSAFFEGNLGEGDVDHFQVSVPAGKSQFAFACGAERSGSGLRGLKAEILGADGTPVAGASATESATADLFKTDLAVPNGATTLVIKVSATSQAADVSSDFYRCGWTFFSP